MISMRILLYQTKTCYVATWCRSITTGQWKKYLSILKLDSNSTPKDVKDSFLRLSKIYHPDNKSTGSHAKFVELKEAYDALKDGQVSPSSAVRQQYDPDLTYKSQTRYRDNVRNKYGTGSYDNNHTRDPWEAFARERQYQKQKADWESFGQRRPFSSGANLTIFLGAISWIVIYSSVLLIWDYNDAVKRGLSKYNVRNHDEYLAYEEYLRRKEQRKLLNLQKRDIFKEQSDEPK